MQRDVRVVAVQAAAQQPLDDRQAVGGRAGVGTWRRAGSGPPRSGRTPPGRRGGAPAPAETFPSSPRSRTVQARTYSEGCREEFGRQGVVEPAADVQAPEPLQGEAGVVGLPGQRAPGPGGSPGRGGPASCERAWSAYQPFGWREQRRPARRPLSRARSRPRTGFVPGRGDPVDPAVAAVPVRVGVGVGGPPVVEVADVDRAVGPLAQVGGAEPGVARVEQPAAVGRGERRAAPRRAATHDAECWRKSAAEQRAAEAGGQGVAEVDRPARARARPPAPS